MSESTTWTATILSSGETEGACQWITDHGGWNNFTANDMGTDFSPSWIYQTPVTGYSFTVTPHILDGIGAYWIYRTPPNPAGGNTILGCGFI